LAKTGKKVAREQSGSRKKAAGRPRTRSKPKKKFHGYEVVGTTSDGVVLLRGAVKPDHFTSREIRQAIREVVSTKA
jgi:hypothetical protein